MNWPFELPLPAYQRIYFCNKCGYIGQVGESHPDCDYLAAGSGPFFSQEQVNACITAALRWAAEQCAPGSPDYGSAKMALIDRRDRILAALPKKG